MFLLQDLRVLVCCHYKFEQLNIYLYIFFQTKTQIQKVYIYKTNSDIQKIFFFLSLSSSF